MSCALRERCGDRRISTNSPGFTFWCFMGRSNGVTSSFIEKVHILLLGASGLSSSMTLYMSPIHQPLGKFQDSKGV